MSIFSQKPLAAWLSFRKTGARATQSPILRVSDQSRELNSRRIVSTAKVMGCQPLRTAYRSPWQNGVAERWIGSVRRELLDHVIVLNHRHLKRLMKDYVRYYHEDRTHLGLGKDTPDGRIPESASLSWRNVIALKRLGGLHHRYAVAA